MAAGLNITAIQVGCSAAALWVGHDCTSVCGYLNSKIQPSHEVSSRMIICMSESRIWRTLIDLCVSCFGFKINHISKKFSWELIFKKTLFIIILWFRIYSVGKLNKSLWCFRLDICSFYQFIVIRLQTSLTTTNSRSDIVLLRLRHFILTIKYISLVLMPTFSCNKKEY